MPTPMSSFENFPTASPDEVVVPFVYWRNWLRRNGHLKVGDLEDPWKGILGLWLPEADGDLLEPEPVVACSKTPALNFEFKGYALNKVRSMVDKASVVLGIGPVAFQASLIPPHVLLEEGKPPVGPHERAVLFHIPNPVGSGDGLQARNYALNYVGGQKTAVQAWRIDKTGDGDLVRNDLGFFPEITSVECLVLGQLHAACEELLPTYPGATEIC